MAVNRAIKPTKGQGDPFDNYVLTTIPKPKAAPKNVIVRVVLRPVNPCDLIASRIGVWAKPTDLIDSRIGDFAKQLDFKDVVVGGEGVGVVDEVGEGVTKVKVGQRVIPLAWGRYYPHGYGLWRDYIEVPEIDCIPVPDDMADEVAAQFVINPWTAYGLLKRLQIPKGEILLLTAAGSTLGRLIISLAKHYGVKTIAVVRRDKWIQPLTDLGAVVINSSTEDVKEKAMEITGGKGAYGAIDQVATESTRLAASCVRDGGLVLVCGLLSGSDVRVNIADMVRQVTFEFFGLWPSLFSENLQQREETVNVILELFSKKIFNPLIGGKEYPLEDFKEAMKETEIAGRGGKVFLSSY